MTKREFMLTLQKRLCGLPKQELDERLNFYSEIIDDRIEEGCAEEEAVLALGSVDEIAMQIIAEIPLTKIAKERIKSKRRFKVWEIVLLAVGSPIWLSLAIAAFAVILSLYAVLWSVVVSLWAVFVSFAACAVGGAVAGTLFACTGHGLAGVAVIGAGIVCAGLAIVWCFGCNAATKGTLLLTKKIALGIKRCFVGKETVA